MPISVQKEVLKPVLFICSRCGTLTEWDESLSPDPLCVICWDIQSESSNKETARRHEYRQSHREKINAKRREYYQSHREKINAKRREYYQSHREKINAKRREYYQSHRGDKR